MKVLVTGTEGYIGHRLATWLSTRGHEVTGFDTGYYRDGTLYTDPAAASAATHTVYRDLRTIKPEDFDNIDAVVHLAELSNDPLGENNRDVTFDINHQGTRKIANAAKQAGVSRFVYASSCSVYGVASADIVDEDSPVNPQTAYAECKVLSETDLLELAEPGFCVSALRNATVYGPSPRMRFDIVLNDLAALAWTKKEIAMISDGSPWRPIVHIEDVCEAIRCTLEAPTESVNGEVFNVGNSNENYRVREIAELVSSAFPGCCISIGPPSSDNRSYRVNFDKIEKTLPNFATRWCAADGAKELNELFTRIQMSDETYAFRAFTRLKQLTWLKETGQVDNHLYWQSQ